MTYNDKNTRFINRSTYKWVLFFNFFNFSNSFLTPAQCVSELPKKQSFSLSHFRCRVSNKGRRRMKVCRNKICITKYSICDENLALRTIIFIYGGSLNGLFHHGLVWSQIMYIYVRTTQRLYLRSEERSANALRNKHHYIFNCLLRSFK